MHIHLERRATTLRDIHDLDRFWIATDLPQEVTTARLRTEGIGYQDGGTAFVNTFWLRSAECDPTWLARFDDMLAAAAARNTFDGVFLRAAVHPSFHLYMRATTRSAQNGQLTHRESAGALPA